MTGIGLLPSGKPKDELAKALDRTLQVFSGRVLTFDTIAAWSYADLAVKVRKGGRSYATADIYTAAIASAHGLPVAARNAAIFESLNVPVICPWDADR